MLRRNCTLEEIEAAAGLRGYRCMVCGRQGSSRYGPEQVHRMCHGTPAQFAAWRSAAKERFVGALQGMAELAARHGAPCRQYEKALALYAQCECCPDWQVTMCRRLKCPGRSQKYLRLLLGPGQCPVWGLNDASCAAGPRVAN